MSLRTSLVPLLGILAVLVLPSVGVSADAGATASTPEYRIYPLRNGTCQIAGNHAFHGGSDPKSRHKAIAGWHCFSRVFREGGDADSFAFKSVRSGARHCQLVRRSRAIA